MTAPAFAKPPASVSEPPSAAVPVCCPACAGPLVPLVYAPPRLVESHVRHGAWVCRRCDRPCGYLTWPPSRKSAFAQTLRDGRRLGDIAVSNPLQLRVIARRRDTTPAIRQAIAMLLTPAEPLSPR